MNICVKRREAPVAYTIDWGRGWLSGADIVDSRWTVDGQEPGGVTATGVPAGEGLTRAAIRGGVPGARYTVHGHVQLSDGRRGTRRLSIQIGGGR